MLHVGEPNTAPDLDEERCRTWILTIPVKLAAQGKSRLQLAAPVRQQIVRAIALDTIEAAAACERVARVLVVTADSVLADSLVTHERVRVVPDTLRGLRAAIALGLAAADVGAPRGVLLGDLPGPRSQELSQALLLAGQTGRAFVPDADGTGTVLATARQGIPLRIWFGPGSAAAHRNDGFAELHLPASWGLRRDLDTAEHLEELRTVGLGAHTAAFLG